MAEQYNETFNVGSLADVQRVLDTIEAKLYAQYNMTLKDVRAPDGARIVCKWGSDNNLELVFEFFDEQPEPLTH